MQNFLTQTIDLSSLRRIWERLCAQVWIVPVMLVMTLAWGTWRLVQLAAHCVRNIPFWDELTVTEPLIGHRGMLAAFLWQNGPHREGRGGWLQILVIQLSGWNEFAEAYVLLGLLVLAAVLALWICYRVSGNLHLADCTIPLLILTPAQYEHWASSIHYAHSVVPLVLLLASGLLWLTPASWKRLVGLLLLNFMAVFTGFSLFLGPLTLLLFLIEAWQSQGAPRRQAILGAVLSALTLAAFFLGWQFRPANPKFGVVHPSLAEYGAFAATLIGHPFQAGAHIGGLLLMALAVLALLSGWALLRKQNSATNRILFLLAAFSLIFCLFDAYGRTSLGIHAAFSSRYTTLLLPGLFALYLAARVSGPLWSRRLLPVLLLLPILFLVSPITPDQEQDMDHLATIKGTWIATYRQTGSIALADRAAGFSLMAPINANKIPPIIAYLRTHHLSFFRTP